MQDDANLSIDPALRERGGRSCGDANLVRQMHSVRTEFEVFRDAMLTAST
jgi:hypothetical protein